MKTASPFTSLCLLTFLVLACNGCAVHSGGTIYSSHAWERGHRASGKVLVIVSGRESEDEDTHNGGAAHLAEDVVVALQRLPHTTVVNAGEKSVKWTPDPTDSQAITLAKSRGADSVCVISVGRCDANFSVWFWPPLGLETTTGVLYSMRLIDARTGDYLLHSVKSVSRGGWWCPCNPFDGERDFKKALQCDLGVPPCSDCQDDGEDGTTDVKEKNIK